MTRPTTAREWNERYPIGTHVNAYPGSRTGRVIATRTRSEAWNLPGGTPVVNVAGHTGGIALTHVEPADTEPDGSTVWNIAHGVRTHLPNGRTVYQRSGGALSVRWWDDGRVETLDPTFLIVGDEVRLACARCKTRPVPDSWCSVRMCDQCLAEAITEADAT